MGRPKKYTEGDIEEKGEEKLVKIIRIDGQRTNILKMDYFSDKQALALEFCQYKPIEVPSDIVEQINGCKLINEKEIEDGTN